VPDGLPVPAPPIAEGTACHGDTFVVHSGRDGYLFGSSAMGDVSTAAIVVPSIRT
jgi:hypothetical protein